MDYSFNLVLLTGNCILNTFPHIKMPLHHSHFSLMVYSYEELLKFLCTLQYRAKVKACLVLIDLF